MPRPAIDASLTAANNAPPYDAWARVLGRYVDEQGRVDFAAIASDRADLDRFVAYVYDVSPQSAPQHFNTAAVVLAFHLNAYNALAMHKVIDRGVPVTLAGLRKVSFFAFGPVMVGGRAITLYDYENKVIRPLGDPRLHMALNCMSAGCPRLPRAPFLPGTLDRQLERETRFFFSEQRNLQIDHGARVARVSAILKFFPEDFLRVAPSLIAFINRYVDTSIPSDYRLDYIPYDWTIHRQP